MTETEPVETSPSPAGPLRILLVEDNPLNQIFAVNLLERNGYRVVVAEDGRQALGLLSGSTFDLVLMDLQMPVMDGFEATAAIRRSDRDDWRMPVIAVTANDPSEERERCLAAGFDGFVPKPIRWPILKAAIDLCAGRTNPAETPGDPLNGPDLA